MAEDFAQDLIDHRGIRPAPNAVTKLGRRSRVCRFRAEVIRGELRPQAKGKPAGHDSGRPVLHQPTMPQPPWGVIRYPCNKRQSNLGSESNKIPIVPLKCPPSRATPKADSLCKPGGQRQEPQTGNAAEQTLGLVRSEL